MNSMALAENSLILMVDDVPMNIRILGTILKSEKYSFAVATNGAETFAVLGEQTPDLILLDVMLPDIDGFEICRRIKEDDRLKEIPVIFLTAKVELEDKIRGFKLGAVDYITKPFDEDEVIIRVRTHLQLKKYNDMIRKAYAELEKSQKEKLALERKNSALALAVTANHELNQPLMALQGNLEMLVMSLETANLTDKQQHFVTEIQQAMERMSDILTRFKNASDLEFKSYEDEADMVVFDPQ